MFQSSNFKSAFNLDLVTGNNILVDEQTIIINANQELEVGAVPFAAHITETATANPTFNILRLTEFKTVDADDKVASKYYVDQAISGAGADFLRVDGTNEMKADLDTGGYKIVDLANGTNPADAINKGQLDALDTTLSGLISTNTTNIATNASNIATNTTNIATNTADISTLNGLQSTYLLLDGTRNMAGNLNMNTNYIINVPNPVNANDAANKAYVDAAFTVGTYVRVDGTSTMTGNLDLGNTNYVLNAYQYEATFPSNPTLGQVHYNYDKIEQLANVDMDYFVPVNYGHVFKSSGFSTTTICKIIGDGTGDYIDMNSNQIRNMADPTSNQHAATKKYVDDEVKTASGLFLKLDGSTPMAGNLDIGGGTNYIFDSYQYVATHPSGFASGEITYEYRGVYGNSNHNIIYQVPDTYAHIFQGSGGSTQEIARLNCNISLAQVWLDMVNNRIIQVADPVNNKDAANKDYVDGCLKIDSSNDMTGRYINFSNASFSSGDYNRVEYYTDGIWSQGIYLDGATYKLITTMGTSGQYEIYKGGNPSTGTRLLNLNNGGSLSLTPTDNDNRLRLWRASASGRAQYTLENETGTTQYWRCGLTGAGGVDYSFFTGTDNILQLNRCQTADPAVIEIGKNSGSVYGSQITFRNSSFASGSANYIDFASTANEQYGVGLYRSGASTYEMCSIKPDNLNITWNWRIGSFTGTQLMSLDNYGFFAVGNQTSNDSIEILLNKNISGINIGNTCRLVYSNDERDWMSCVKKNSSTVRQRIESMPNNSNYSFSWRKGGHAGTEMMNLDINGDLTCLGSIRKKIYPEERIWFNHWCSTISGTLGRVPLSLSDASGTNITTTTHGYFFSTLNNSNTYTYNGVARNYTIFTPSKPFIMRGGAIYVRTGSNDLCRSIAIDIVELPLSLAVNTRLHIGATQCLSTANYVSVDFGNYLFSAGVSYAIYLYDATGIMGYGLNDNTTTQSLSLMISLVEVDI